MAEPSVPFADVLRGLRTGARLTQEELAEAAGLSPRAISDLERGMVTTPHKDTVRLLADALGLGGWTRVEFEAAARGRAAPDRTRGGGRAAATRTLPRDIASFTPSWLRLVRTSPGVVMASRAWQRPAGRGSAAVMVCRPAWLATCSDLRPAVGAQIRLPKHANLQIRSAQRASRLLYFSTMK